MTDGRCRFGPRAKREMVARVLAGEAARQVARSMGCSPTTVTTTRDRWLAASEAERTSGVWCVPRRPVPRSCPWALSAAEEQLILDARAEDELGADASDVADGAPSLDVLEGAGAVTVSAASAAAKAGRARGATSGPRPARCCTSTPSSCPSSRLSVTGRTATAPIVTARAARARSRSSASSTTAPAWPTARSTPPRPRSRSLRRCAAPPPGCASRAAARSGPS